MWNGFGEVGVTSRAAQAELERQRARREAREASQRERAPAFAAHPDPSASERDSTDEPGR
jgi:hypothetical protein